MGVTTQKAPEETIPSLRQDGGICDRTDAVETAIIAAITGVTACEAVTSAHLEDITSLNLEGQSIASLQSGDFAGLTGLTTLNLGFNSLRSLSADIFDSLSELTTLQLYQNSLESLPASVFDELTKLTALELDSNSLESLPASVFDELTKLTTLEFDSNSLESLPASVFDKLTELTTLRLSSNSLTSLSADVFNKLTALTTLYLNDNALTGLPDDVFEKLTVLSLLDLSDNPGKAGFKPTADAGERQVVERVTVVTLDGSESDGGPRGANFFYSWVKTTGPDLTLTGSDTTMPTFTAPGARDDLVFTLTVTGRGVDNESNPYTDRAEARVKVPTVCDRTDAVADAIVAAVDGVTTCGAVTSAHLQGITTLILEGQSIASLHSGDSRASPRLQRCISTITLWRACRQTS